MKQSQTTIKELSAMYSAVLKRGILCNAIALGLVAAPAMAETTLPLNVGNGTQLTISNETFSGVSERAANDWAIVENGGNLTLDNVIFGTLENGNSNGYNGIINNWNVLDISNSTFTNNSSVWGGAIYNTGTAHITNTSFNNNTVTIGGGAIYNSGTMTIGDDTSFVGNSSKSGGAIYNANGGNLSVGDNALFKDNTAEYGSNPYGGSDVKNFGTLTIGDNAVFTRTTYQDPIYDDAYDTGIFTMNGSHTTIGDNAYFHNIGQALNNEGNTVHVIGDNAVFDYNGSVITNFGGSYVIGDNAQFKNSQFITLANKGNGSSITIGDNALFQDNHDPLFDLGGGSTWVYMNGDGVVANNNSANSTITFGDGLVVNHNDSYGKGVIYNVASSTVNFNGASEFTNNVAEDGIIYNKGIVNFAGDTSFSGSKNNAEENVSDIYNTGIVNITAAADDVLNFAMDGGINGASSTLATNKVNIKGTGTVNLTGAINNQTITVVNGAELWLSDGATDGSNLAGSVMTVNGGGTINTIDNVINDYSGIISLNNNANIKGDVNFLDGVADMYAAGSGSTVNYKVGNLIGNIGKGSKTIQVVSDGATVDISEAQWTSENGATFESTSAADGSMIVRGFDGGVAAAADASATVQNIQYQLTEDEQLAISKQIQNNFVLNGDGIDDADQGLELADANLTIADGAIVEINDLKLAGNGALNNVETAVLYINNSNVNVALNNAGTLYSDPTTYSATVTNTGTASFDNDTFTATAVLANNGVANMTNDVTFESGATITGSGVTNLVNGTTHFNNTASGNTVKLALGADFDGALVGGNLNTQNKAIDNVSGTVSGADLYVDAELASVSGDIDRFADASTSVVKNINIVSNEYGSQGSYTLNLSGAALADDLTFSGNMNYYTDVTQDGDDVVFSNKLVNNSSMHDQLGDWNAGNYIAGSNGYDSTTNSYVDADATHTVGAALTALDTQAKTNADAILTLNGGVDIAGSVANTVKNTAADADYDNTVSGLTATTIQGAIDENTVAINGNTAAIATLNNAMAANNALTLNQSVAYTDQRIEKLDKDLSSGIASAIALTSVAASGVQKGEVAVSGGYGYYNGQSAAAFGAAMGLSKRWSVNAGAGVSSSDVSFRAGTTYRFKAF